MLRKTNLRRTAAVLAMLAGAALIFLSYATWVGALLFASGMLIEVVGIALKRRE